MPHRINLIPEDAARPEVTQATADIPEASRVQFKGGGLAIGQLSQLDERGRMGWMLEDSGVSLSTMSGPPDRPCAETHSRERQ
jgi:hypothetical protein